MRTYSIEEVKALVPQKMKSYVTDEIVSMLNDSTGDEADDFNENFMSFVNVCRESYGSLKDYIDAVRFCTHKLRGATDLDAWKWTFPDKYTYLRSSGKDDGEVGAWVRSYKSKKLVVNILQHAIVPVQISHYHLMHKALSALGEELERSKGMTRVKAAEALLNILKPSETAKMQINVTSDSSDKLADLTILVNELVTKERAMITAGVITPQQAIERKIETEIIEVE